MCDRLLQLNISFHLEIYILVSFLSKNKRVGRYIGTGLCMSQDQQNHSLVIHDKVEDLFTTVT